MKSFNEQLLELEQWLAEPQFHLKTTVELGEGLSVDVSTCELPYTMCGGFETCLFVMREGNNVESEVVAIYRYRSEAELAHEGFTNPAVLRSILGLIRERNFLVDRIREGGREE